MTEYHWYREHDWEDREVQPIEFREVRVECEGRVVSGVTAHICRYRENGPFCLDTSYERWVEHLHLKATRRLRASGRFLSMEYTGYPECTEDHVTLMRVSDIDLDPRRRMLASIPAAARIMKQKHAAADQETRMLRKWAVETDFPEDLEHYVHQFLRPQSYRTWSQIRI